MDNIVTDSRIMDFSKSQDIQIFNKDCQKGLRALNDVSIDFIVTDPPYFIDGMGDEWNDKIIQNKAKKSGVIGGLPVGMKFDRAQGERLQAFMNPIAKEFLRILKPGGFCVVFSQARLYHRMAMSLDLAGFEIRDMLAWKYEGQAKAFSQSHFIKKDKNLTEEQKESLIRELEGYKTPQLKPQMEPMVLAQKPKAGTFVQNWQKYRLGLLNTKESLDGKFPSNVMEVPKHIRHHENEEKIEHLTRKPVRLISHLIRLFTQEGQIVLDPFMSSGSHAIAALQNHRKFIGYEIEKKYFEMARQRIEKEILHSKENMMAYAREADLFVELAQPDEKGFSRLVSVSEFVGKYEVLSSKNGYPWLRDGSHGGITKSELSIRYNIYRDPPTGKLKAVGLNGYVDK